MYNECSHTHCMEWRAVVGLEGRYEVSDTGLVRGLDRCRKGRWGHEVPIKGVTLKQRPNRYGYMMVPLGIGVKQKKLCTVHRLVLIAFTEDRPDMQVNHKDGDKANNNLSNLEWVTASQNCQHREDKGLGIRGEKAPRGKLTADQVLEIRRLHDEGQTQTALGETYGVSQHSVWMIVRRKSWAHV